MYAYAQAIHVGRTRIHAKISEAVCLTTITRAGDASRYSTAARQASNQSTGPAADIRALKINHQSPLKKAVYENMEVHFADFNYYL
jgi:hypothetical protein